jgi:DNA-binding NarL/FixJ family response regulator
MKHARVLGADDHALFLAGLWTLLEPEYEVVSAVSDGRALLEATARIKREVIIVDISLPVLNGIEAAASDQKRSPGNQVSISYDACPSRLSEGGPGCWRLRVPVENVRAGRIVERAAGCYQKPSSRRSGSRREIVEQFERHPRHFTVSQSVLTTRQREIRQLVAEGRTAKEIGGILNVALQTVAFHKYTIMNRLGLRMTAELTKSAIQRGLVAS